MKFDFLFLDKTKLDFIAAGIEDYRKRLHHYGETSIKIINTRRLGKLKNAEIIKQQEGQLLLEDILPSSYKIVLDGRGRQVTSPGLADIFSQLSRQGKGRIVFLIGGAYGLDGEVLAHADLVLSLSDMTFTHEMARLILLEQVYRACTINAGSQYHK